MSGSWPSSLSLSLRLSTSNEVAGIANLVARDAHITTVANLRMIDRLSGHSAWVTSQEKLRDTLVENDTVIVDNRSGEFLSSTRF